MYIFINSKRILLDKSVTLDEVLKMDSQIKGNFAVALNRVFVPRGQYSKTHMSEGDEIDVVYPMQGG